MLARCRDRVSPPITPLVEELPSDDDSRRVLVFIQPATGTAHTFRRGNEGAKHYVRVSRSTIEARNGVLRELLVRKGALEPWDRRPCNGATTNDLDLSRCAMLFSGWAFLAGARGRALPGRGCTDLAARPFPLHRRAAHRRAPPAQLRGIALWTRATEIRARSRRDLFDLSRA